MGALADDGREQSQAGPHRAAVEPRAVSARGYREARALTEGNPLGHHQTVRKWVNRFTKLGIPGLEESPRHGRPHVYKTEHVGTVIQTALTKPDELGLPFGSWTLDRLVAYLSEEKGIMMGRSRMSEIFRNEGLRWRQQEGWYGQKVDPEFAEEPLAAGSIWS